MIVRQHFAKILDVVILGVLLSKLTHLDFGIVALEGFFQEGLAGLVLRRRADGGCRQGNGQEDCRTIHLALHDWLDRGGKSASLRPVPPRRWLNAKLIGCWPMLTACSPDRRNCADR